MSIKKDDKPPEPKVVKYSDSSLIIEFSKLLNNNVRDIVDSIGEQVTPPTRKPPKPTQ